MILDKVSYPKDLKNLSIDELNQLASEIRTLLINKATKTGGHLDPNLGIVEATIAMHYVFDCPKDKVVFDISHQCYVHKILTGRKDGFIEEKITKNIQHFQIQQKVNMMCLKQVIHLCLFHSRLV